MATPPGTAAAARQLATGYALCNLPRTEGLTPLPGTSAYFERDDHLDVVRLLGERQDILAILGAEFGSN
ncbi:MAG: hypothetical protein AB7U92_01005 [Piscinibacter sp.]|jgi:hypothetical protein|uniref:hypothetical protein n=1 Tax=Piscinibacter sp. TaxID=1903157 RepID=UPI003D140FF0